MTSNVQSMFFKNVLKKSGLYRGRDRQTFVFSISLKRLALYDTKLWGMWKSKLDMSTFFCDTQIKEEKAIKKNSKNI